MPFPHQHMPWYRSNFARITAAMGGAMLCYAFGFGAPEWHDTASLRWLHQLVPWSGFAVFFGVYSLLLAVGTAAASVFGNAMGLGAFLIEFVALCFTVKGHTFNPIIFDAVLLAAVLHFHVLRLAIRQLEFDRAHESGIDLL